MRQQARSKQPSKAKRLLTDKERELVTLVAQIIVKKTTAKADTESIKDKNDK